MAYVTATETRVIAPITTSQVSDVDMATFIQLATSMLNESILGHVYEEVVTWIDEERENDINGTNTTFYTRNKPLADLDDDGDVDTSDVEVYYFDTSGTRSTATVSSVDAKTGKFVVSVAPQSSYDIRVTYRYAPVNLNTSTISPLLKLAVMQLTAALCYTKINPANINSYSLDKLRVSKMSDEYTRYYSMYQNTLQLLNDKISRAIQINEMPEDIPNPKAARSVYEQ